MTGYGIFGVIVLVGLSIAWYRKYGRGQGPFFGEKIKRWSANEEKRPPLPGRPSLPDESD